MILCTFLFQMWWRVVQRLNGLNLAHIFKTAVKICCCLNVKEVEKDTMSDPNPLIKLGDDLRCSRRVSRCYWLNSLMSHIQYNQIRNMLVYVKYTNIFLILLSYIWPNVKVWNEIRFAISVWWILLL